MRIRTMIRFGWPRSFAAIALAALLGAGCTNTPKSAGTDRMSPDEYPQVVVESGRLIAPNELNKRIVLHGEPVVQRDPFRVAVILRHHATGKTRYVQYRFRFFDANGVMLDNDPDWHYLELPPRARQQVRGVALDSSAVDWELEIRPAN